MGDTLIGWQLPTDAACLSFFPQNDSSSYPLCYRDQSASLKIYDIENERGYFDYQLGPNKILNLTNTTTHIMHNKWQMWVMNWIPFDEAEYLGREEIGVEWIENAGVGEFAKKKTLDHFNLLPHHVWTDPDTARLFELGSHSMDCRCTIQML